MKKALCLLLAAVLVVMCLPLGVLAAEKEDTTREIAVVFDNSGSMYMWNDAWSRATYAIEVFAAMMNPGDTLKVFPMNPVTTSKGEYASGQAITVRSLADIAEIHEMYTPRAGGTPMESISYAFDDLTGSTADEKWLIVVTDGGTFHKNSVELSESATVSELTDLLGQYSGYADDFYVQYLGIGAGTAQPDLPQSTHYRSATAPDSSRIVETLTSACNEIFGRDTLPDSCRSGQQLTFDVTMKKMIVFAQGADAAINGLTGPAGAVPEAAGTRYTVTWSDKGCGNYDTYIVDETLGGVMATYGPAAAGTYTLDYAGRDVAVYYEPDVSLTAIVTDADGNVVDGTDPNLTLPAGQYTVTYGLVDNGTGDVTTSDLLGTVAYDATATVGGQSQVLTSGVPVTLNEGDTLEFDIRAAYLSGYEARYTSDDYFPYGPPTVTPGAAGALAIAVTGGQTSYTVSSLAGEGSYTLQFTYDGNALTAEEMAALQLTVDAPAGITAAVSKDGSSGGSLTLAPDTGLAEGEYTVTVHGLLPHDNMDDATASAAVSFTLAADALQLQLSAEKTYLVVGQLDTADPFVATVTHNGAPVDNETLAELARTLTVEIKGSNVGWTAAPVPDASQIAITLVHAGAAEATTTGGCKMTVTAAMPDAAGAPLTASDDLAFTLGVLPIWVIILIILAILAVLIAIYSAIMSMKVLPRQMSLENPRMLVNGDPVPGEPATDPAKGSKTATLSVASPRVMANPEVTRFGVTVELFAVSKRSVKSSKRRAGVAAINVRGGINLNTVTIGGNVLQKNEDTNKLQLRGYKPEEGLPLEYDDISDGDICRMSGEFQGTDVTLELEFHFE